MEEFSVEDPTQLLEAASDFAHHPVAQNDASAKDFLDRFPLPVILNALQTKADVPGLENTLVACLERIFGTKYGAALIPQYMPFLQVGLRADSQAVRCLSCKTVSSLLESVDGITVSAAQLVNEYDLYPLLLDCLVYGNEQVSTASMDVIKNLACSPEGMVIIFPANSNEATHLRSLAARCSSLGRVRILALIVKLFSISSSVASVIYNSNLLSLLEAEVSNTNDTLVTLSVLELLYELAEIQHGAEFLSRTTLLQLLSSIISNTSVGSVFRSRAMMISGRLVCKENVFVFIDESSVKTVISAIDGRLGSLESQDTDECESALEALGQIGSSIQGAALLLSSSPPAARHVIDVAFDRQAHGKQLAALHALGNISGETRSESNRILNGDAEESLRRLIYETASKSSKLTPSGLFLSVLQQESEIRLALFISVAKLVAFTLLPRKEEKNPSYSPATRAEHIGTYQDEQFYVQDTSGSREHFDLPAKLTGYRLLTGLVARPWCLMEICSKQEIINIVTDAHTETTKIGMEAKYNCCKAIHQAFMSSNNLVSDPALTGIATKLQESVRRGPYLARKNPEAQPLVVTADRF